MHEPSDKALPNLLMEGWQFGMLYIDGCHTIDYAFADFFDAGKLLAVGGVVEFNDVDCRYGL